jgi:hypothetical protein
MNRKIKLLARTYFSILVIIFLLIVFTPHNIQSRFSMLEDQLLEAASIILLFIVGYVVLLMCRKEVTRNRCELNRLKQDKSVLKHRLGEAYHYIGTVNIQIQEIKSVLSKIRKFPENKKDFHYVLHFLADRTLSMINAEWVLFRIIDIRDLDMLCEHSETRGSAVLPKRKISNRDLASNRKLKGYTAVRSGQENFHIKTFCILPMDKVPIDYEVFIKAVVNEIEMLFLIFTSIYYKNSMKKVPYQDFDFHGKVSDVRINRNRFAPLPIYRIQD